MLRSGFTLIELAVMLVLIALLSTTVAWSLTGPNAAAQLDDAVQQLVRIDRLARDQARNHGRTMRLSFLPGSNAIRRIDLSDPDRTAEVRAIPSGFEIRLVRIAALDAEHGERGGREVLVSANGQTPTYAVQITSVNRDDDTTQRRWVLFAGMTGQVIHTDDEADIDAAIALVETEARLASP